MTMDISDETLMAFADGELDEAQMAQIEQALSTDDQLVTRLSVFLESRTAAFDALQPLLQTPVPEALRSNIDKLIAGHSETPSANQPSKIVSLAEKRRPFYARFDLAAAACISLIAGGVVGFALSGSDRSSEGSDILATAISDDGLVKAMESVRSGAETRIANGSRIRIIASFQDDLGLLCREFEVDGTDGATSVSVACANDGKWQVKFLVSAPSTSDNQYAPASSLEALDAYLSAIGATQPMNQADEAKALDLLR